MSVLSTHRIFGFVTSAAVMMSVLGSGLPRTAHAQIADAAIVGSWVCESNVTPVGQFSVLGTFNAGGTVQFGSDNNVFGEAHGIYQPAGLGKFQSIDETFLFNGTGGASDSIRVVRATETITSATTMTADANVTIADRAGNVQMTFSAVLTCNRLAIDFAANR